MADRERQVVRQNLRTRHKDRTKKAHRDIETKRERQREGGGGRQRERREGGGGVREFEGERYRDRSREEGVREGER